MDFSAGTWPEGADSVRTIKVDFDEPAIISVAFPRDLWVQTGILADQNISATRLGQVYEYMKDTTTGSDKHRVSAASVAIAQTLLDNFQLPSDQYFTLQLQFVANMIDTIGVVPINNPYAFTTEYGITFPAGEQVLNGALSAEFVRAYTPGGDPARRERQDLYVTALHQKVLSPEILLKVPDLYKQFDQVIVTDLTPEQINALACMANLVPPSQVKYYEIDETMTTPREIGEPVPVLDPNVPAITNQLKIWLGY